MGRIRENNSGNGGDNMSDDVNEKELKTKLMSMLRNHVYESSQAEAISEFITSNYYRKDMEVKVKCPYYFCMPHTSDCTACKGKNKVTKTLEEIVDE